MKIILIRHAMTRGNMDRRYIGITDEPLCQEGIEQLRKRVTQGVYPVCDRVVVSPQRRCVQTANIIYPGKTKEIEPDFMECNFGKFEGKNHKELSSDKDYRCWVESNGTMPFPGGESVTGFKNRCALAFENTVSADYQFTTYENIMRNRRKRQSEVAGEETVAMVIHGGTIMSIMERYDTDRKNYYDYMVDNCCGYLIDFDGERIKLLETI